MAGRSGREFARWSMNLHIVAVIVTYKPDISLLQTVVASLVRQVDSTVIVDNGSDIDSRMLECSSPVLIVSIGSNIGVAAAQNRGIEVARRQHATHVLLLDHDSIVAPGMVTTLLRALASLPDAACVGPRYLDPRQQNPPPFIRVRGLRLERLGCDIPGSIVKVDYLIASGCLIPLHVIDRVGGMREDLFIDYVDIEWGLRAARCGFQSYGVCDAEMEHSLGEYPIRFLGRSIPLHSPLRHYYHFRNAVRLYKESWIPLNWKLVDAFRLCLKFIFYSAFAVPRFAHFRMMLLGMLHGVRGVGGELVRGDR